MATKNTKGHKNKPWFLFVHLWASWWRTNSMFRWFLLFLALAAALLGSLTVIKSPDWAPRKLAVLAGEYGHRLARGNAVALPWATHACEFNLSGPGGQLTTFAPEWFLAAVTK
jgi:hypothetical protein